MGFFSLSIILLFWIKAPLMQIIWDVLGGLRRERICMKNEDRSVMESSWTLKTLNWVKTVLLFKYVRERTRQQTVNLCFGFKKCSRCKRLSRCACLVWMFGAQLSRELSSTVSVSHRMWLMNPYLQSSAGGLEVCTVVLPFHLFEQNILCWQTTTHGSDLPDGHLH